MESFIKTTAQLEDACAAACADGVLALDTEFVWNRTYRPRLGLVQMGRRGACWALDCMTRLSPAPLAGAVASPDVVKILHDARQDLALVREYAGAKPCNVFDTQLAAAFVGYPRGIGLQKLLSEVAGVDLPKTETLTNWLRRPLTAAQIEYALDDVRYLPDLMDALVAKACKFGTGVWMAEEMKRAEEAMDFAERPPDEAWTRVKLGRARLGGPAFAILRAVAAVREESARKWNLPRGWLGDDMSLVEIASTGSVRRLKLRLPGSQGDTICRLYAKAVDSAKALPESEWPRDPRKRRYYIDEVKAAADTAHDWLAARALELHVDASVIATRANVEAYVDDVADETNPLASGWRYEVAGREIAARFAVD